ncbi:MAG: methyltransferase domain-containing protein, partial [Desulfobacteraceae bacterium]|nr:methyltransferase domain-containing protein [Desulfobacteraceae bacterium]
SRLLDVGCGTGATVEHLLRRFGFRAAGVDPSPSMLAMARAGHRSLCLIGARGESLPFSDCFWDGILAECSLSLARDPDGFVRECFRVLKSGGRLILSDIYLRNTETDQPLRALSADCCLGGALPRESLGSILVAAGFVVLAWEDHSPALKHFVGQLILSGVFPPQFPGRFTGSGCRVISPLEGAIAEARPGYFLAIAEKPATGCLPGPK